MRSSGAGCVTARIVSLSSSRFINVARFDTGNCPAADKDGTALSDTRLGNEDGPPISCFYAKNVCEYFAEGPLFRGGSADTCPDNLVGDTSSASNGPTTSIPTTSASLPPTLIPPSQTSASVSNTDPTEASSTSRSSIPLSVSDTTRSSTNTNNMSILKPSTTTGISEAGEARPLSRSAFPVATVVGSLVAFTFIAIISLVLFWLRRRRRRTDAYQPQHYIANAIQTPKGNGLQPTISAVTQSQGEAHMEQDIESAAGEPISVNLEREETRDLNEVRDETLAERVRRVEAQMESIMALGLPHGAPPRYSA